jgi:type VI protein secretion system component Hcp
MDQNKTDLVMQFVQNGQPIWAESNLDIDPKDTLMQDFSRNTTYDNYTNFFEVSNFTFSMTLDGSEQSTSALSPQARLTTQPPKAPAKDFARWRSATSKEAAGIPYPLEFENFTFERTIDSASPIFFDSCCRSTEFDSAVLVKRISQGDLGGTVRPSVGYLRIDFTKVLIVGVNWDDGDLVKEQCQFISRQLEIRYRQQDVSGSVGPGAEMFAHWPTPRSRIINGGSGGN